MFALLTSVLMRTSLVYGSICRRYVSCLSRTYATLSFLNDCRLQLPSPPSSSSSSSSSSTPSSSTLSFAADQFERPTCLAGVMPLDYSCRLTIKLNWSHWLLNGYGDAAGDNDDNEAQYTTRTPNHGEQRARERWAPNLHCQAAAAMSAAASNTACCRSHLLWAVRLPRLWNRETQTQHALLARVRRWS